MMNLNVIKLTYVNFCVRTSIFSRIVAPSFVMITSPSGLTSILSIPFGPRLVFKRFATVTAAKILI